MNINKIALSVGILIVLFAGCASERFQFEIEPSGTRIIKGVFDRSVLEHDSTFTWFKANYESYAIDSVVVQEIKTLSVGTHFVMVLGTWCGDSKREVPHLCKIFDSANISKQRVLMIGVDRSKKSQDGLTDKYTILRVPSLIVLKGDLELGRIVESPRETLERDIMKILKKQ